MELDLDAQLAPLLPWALSMRVGGHAYPTSPPTVGQLALLGEIRTLTPLAAKDLLVSLFTGEPRPLVDGMRFEAVTIALGAYAAYFGDYAKKNSGPLSSQLRGALASMGLPFSGTNGSPRS